MSHHLDSAVADLLKVIYEALGDMADWRAAAVCSAVARVWVGDDDPGAAADWLREFLAQRAEARRERQQFRPPTSPAGDGCNPQTGWLTAAERALFAKTKGAADAG